MFAQPPIIASSPADAVVPSGDASPDHKRSVDDKVPANVTAKADPISTTQESRRMESAMGDALLRFLRIRKGPKNDQVDPDAVRHHQMRFGWRCADMI